MEKPREGSSETSRRRQPDRDRPPARVNLRLPSWARDSIGRHGLDLSINAQRSYLDYLKQPAPLVFVVSRNGRFTIWRYCRPGGRCSASTAARSALQRCDRYRVDTPCYIYAVGRKVVWQGKVNQDASLRERLDTAEDTKLLGPDKAKGLLIYFRGYGPWPPGNNYRRVPPYALDFAGAGWDVKLFQVPHHNRPPRNFGAIDGAIRRLVASARREGYRRIVLAGHSRGAWEIIRASNGALPVHGVILSAPAAHGTRILRSGRRNSNFNRGNPAFIQIMQGFSAPRAAFAFFRGDPFMLSNRADLARNALGQKSGVAAFLIDKPDGLPGHGASWSRLFARLWGGCLVAFMERASATGFRCRPARVKIDDPKLVYTSAQMFELGARPMQEAAIRRQIAGVSLFAGPDKTRAAKWSFEHGGHLVIRLYGDWLRGNTVRAHWEVRDNRVCVVNSAIHGRRIACYTVFGVRPGVYGFVRRNRTVRMMYR